MNGRPLSFPIHAENAQKNTAVFDGGDWALKTSTKYAAFFPIKKDNQNTDIKNIAFDYEGQTETNYAKYDFLATGAVQPKDGAVKFTMQRLSAILKIRITMPAGSYGRYGTLIPNKTLFNVKGTLDLSGSEPKYNVTGKAKFIHTQLNADKTSSSEWIYEVYMMIPATDLSDQPLTFSITSDKGLAYEAFLQGKNFEAGKAYLLEATASDAQITNANLIAAAESDNSITFEKESGKVNVNNATNQTLLKQVKKINVISKNDSTVCKQIGYFPALERLDCNNNGITSLDISKNKALTYLDCSNNILTSLDVSYNTNLKHLYCYSNYLTSLDLSNNTALYGLKCSNNKLTSLDLSNNTELFILYCNSNQLTSINLSNNTALSQFQCEKNSLTALDVSNNPGLQVIYCGSNQITSLNVSNNTHLNTLSCISNKLTSLDVSNNPALQHLYCESNQITSLDVSNNPAL
ncbi:MAG: leucine-rich repeat domain-containing protein, partial [Bacteroidales bacterium]|nr:leucine-rich repeat domain-containing protein [Bacteroidales bacterium]